ncbi:hypothetical protein CPZ32_23975 [Bacillus cereus]|nr:hypothetical protein CPZ32_23975 [Bacillus cereus]
MDVLHLYRLGGVYSFLYVLVIIRKLISMKKGIKHL